MGWVRRHIRHGALFGLAALALQIVLSFGHIHLNNGHIDAAHRHEAVAHNALLAQGTQQLPAPNPAGDDDYCAICASIYLAATSLISQAPPVPVPLAFARIEHSFAAERGLAITRLTAFRARAPPAAA
jgi:hypothetical protein